MAVQSFLSHLGDRYVSALVTNTSVDAKELLKLILEDLDLPVAPSSDKSDLLIAFKQMLIEAGRQGKRVIIVIDEAQNLAREVLEEIRLLTNLGQGEEQPVQIVLVGQPELELAVERPDLAQLRQRIRVHYKLAPLTRRELEEYVNHRMRVAGGSEGTFSRAALDRVYSLSGGVPRVVNTLCGDGLLSAYVAGRRTVEVGDIGRDAAGGSASDAPAVGRVEAAQPAAPQRPLLRDAEMATRRESTPQVAPTEPSVRADGAERAPGAAGRRPRPRLGLIIPVAVLAGIVGMLVATGQMSALVAKVRGPAEDVLETPPPAVVQVPAAPAVADSAVTVAADSTVRVATDTTVAISGAIEEKSAVPGARAEAVAPGGNGSPSPEIVQSRTPAATKVVAPVAEKATDGASTGDWYIHISSFRTPEHAQAVASEFNGKGQVASVREQLVNDVVWYRVYLGPLGTHDEAVRRANGLREAGAITYYKVLRLEPGQDS
jgi:type II secretory pathway predicted ATPase ExeA/cell division protein FtsN